MQCSATGPSYPPHSFRINARAYHSSGHPFSSRLPIKRRERQTIHGEGVAVLEGGGDSLRGSPIKGGRQAEFSNSAEFRNSAEFNDPGVCGVPRSAEFCGTPQARSNSLSCWQTQQAQHVSFFGPTLECVTGSTRGVVHDTSSALQISPQL